MSHLTLEALARLLDEPPTEGERAHLGACDACRSELEELRGQTDALAALPDMVPAPDQWPEVRERLLEERLVGRSGHRRFVGPARAAAAVVLFLGGGALGWAVRGQTGGQAAAETLAGTDAPTADGTMARGGGALASDAGAALADDDQPGLRRVEAAEELFFTALDQYMAAMGTSPSDPTTRLATLDNIVLTTAAALNEAPGDPVINSFHLTALAQRNAMLREIASTSSDPVF